MQVIISFKYIFIRLLDILLKSLAKRKLEISDKKEVRYIPKMMELKLTKTLLVHSILEAHLFAQWETKTGLHQLLKRKAILQEDRRLQKK